MFAMDLMPRLQALERKLPFDEVSMLEGYLPHIKRSLGLKDISVHSAEGKCVPEGVVSKDSPLPADPKAVLETGPVSAQKEA
jgi:hypothetical protein